MTSEFRISEATARDMLQQRRESSEVVEAAQVVGEHALVEVTEQVKRLDTDIGAVETTLEQAPEVFDAVGVDLAADVSLSMVVIGVESLPLQFMFEQSFSVSLGSWRYAEIADGRLLHTQRFR